MFSVDEMAKTLIEVDKKYPSKTKDIVQTFANFLKDNKAKYQLRSVIQSLEEEAIREEKNSSLRLILAEDLGSQKIIDKIKQFMNIPLGAKTKVTIDRNIKGGFIAYYQGSIFDASIKNQLIKLKNSLKG